MMTEVIRNRIDAVFFRGGFAACPFCSSPDIEASVTDWPAIGWAVRCGTCGCRKFRVGKRHKRRLREMWNTRWTPEKIIYAPPVDNHPV